MMLLKVLTVKNIWFATIGILKMGSNFKISFVMVVMLCVDLSSIAIITVKGADYYCIIHDI